MKRQTRDELAAECERLREKNTVLSHAVQFLLEKKRPNAVETVRERGGGRYAYQAFDVTAAHGGILLVTYFYPKQRPMTTAHYLEGHYLAEPTRRFTPQQREIGEVIDRLRRKALALQRAHYGIEDSKAV